MMHLEIGLKTNMEVSSRGNDARQGIINGLICKRDDSINWGMRES